MIILRMMLSLYSQTNSLDCCVITFLEPFVSCLKNTTRLVKEVKIFFVNLFSISMVILKNPWKVFAFLILSCESCDTDWMGGDVRGPSPQRSTAFRENIITETLTITLAIIDVD